MHRVQVLLLEHDINTSPFTPGVHACVPPLPWSVTQGDVDDRNRCDPPGQVQEQRCVPASLLQVAVPTSTATSGSGCLAT